MNIKQLQNFIQVYDTGSMSKAAADTFQSQQTLSQSIVSLEKELGAPLFLRSANGSVPTELASAIYDDACLMLATEKHIKAKSELLTQSKCSALSICFANNILGNPDMSLLQEVTDYCEENSLTLSWHEDHPADCEAAVRDGRVDCAFTWYFSPSAEFDSETVYIFKNMLVVSTESELAKKEKLCLEDLASSNFIYSRALGIKQTNSVRLLSSAGIEVTQSQPVSQLDVMWQMIRENKGITTNYKLFKLSPEYCGLVLLDNPIQGNDMHFVLFWRKNSTKAPLYNGLLEHLRSYFAYMDEHVTV